MTSLVLAVLSLTTLLTAGTAWYRRMQRVAIPTNQAPFILLWVLAAALGAASLLTPDAAWPSMTMGAVVILGSVLMLVLHAFGSQRSEGGIEVGDAIPAFSAPDEHGATFESASLTGTLALIKFFRGHW